MISSKIHAMLDYLVGLLLIAVPWLLGFADDSAATVIPVILGASTLLYSILTNYEYSLAKVIPYRIHLTIDFIAGALLLVSPWLFGFSDRIYLPHVILGAFEIVAVLLSRKAISTVHTPRHI
jgi:hypothetical protein